MHPARQLVGFAVTFAPVLAPKSTPKSKRSCTVPLPGWRAQRLADYLAESGG